VAVPDAMQAHSPEAPEQLTLSSRLDYAIVWVPLLMALLSMVPALWHGVPNSRSEWLMLMPSLTVAVLGGLAVWHSWVRLRAAEPVSDLLTLECQMGLMDEPPTRQSRFQRALVLALIAWVTIGDIILWYGFGITQKATSVPSFWVILAMIMTGSFMSLPDLKARGWGVVAGRILLITMASLPLTRVVHLLSRIPERDVPSDLRNLSFTVAAEMLVWIVAGRLYLWWIAVRIYRSIASHQAGELS